MKTKSPKLNINDITYISIMIALISVCAWINIPAAVPFTLQTFAIFFSVLMLGGFKSTIAIVVYLILGTIGVPIFSGFKSGPGAILGVTGGYLVGFLFISLIYLIFEKHLVSIPRKVAALSAGLIFCYLFGTIWFVYLYNKSFTMSAFLSALSICVIPFVIPDLIKLSLALFLSIRISKRLI